MPLNRWLPPVAGLLTAATAATLATMPPGHAYHWPELLAKSAIPIPITVSTCAVTMFLAYVGLPPHPDPGSIIRRTCASAAILAPLLILLQQGSLLSPFVAAFFTWTLLPARVSAKLAWQKFAGAFLASLLLQVGVAAEIAEQSRLAALTLGLAAAPVIWRYRQERFFRGPFQPKWIIALAWLLAILGMTAYLPPGSGDFEHGAVASHTPNAGKQPTDPHPGLSLGGKYRGVILMPEEEKHVALIVPLPMMGRNPFLLHKDPLGIPFYGAYWFFQFPDKSPTPDAYRVKGSPDKMTFRSADLTPLQMEAHQNLGRLIDIGALRRIDVAIRNADHYAGMIVIELILIDTATEERQSMGQMQLVSRPTGDEITQETLRFKIPSDPVIDQFDELVIRFPRSFTRSSRSARIAIDRFFLVPR